MIQLPEHFRSFIALELPLEAREKIIYIIEQLKKIKKYHFVKWTKPENLHITMRFLGNISISEYARIDNKITDICAEFNAFPFCFKDLIVFPSSGIPIVIALKPEPIIELLKLNKLIEDSLDDCDVKPETKAFMPHLTLGKIKHRKYCEVPEIKFEKIDCIVSKLILFKSDISSTGSLYTPLNCYPLQV